MGLLSEINSIFSKKPAPKPTSRPKKPEVVENPPEEEKKVKYTEVLEEKTGSFGTFLHVISLFAFKEAVGDKWPRLKGKAALIAHGIIGKYMHGHTFNQYGEEIFVLIFRDIDREDAKNLALVITDDLGQRLIGVQFETSGAQLVYGAEIDPATAFDAEGNLNPEALRQTIEIVKETAKKARKFAIENSLNASVKKETAKNIQLPEGLKIFFMPCWNLRKESIDTSLLLPAAGKLYGEELYESLANLETLQELDFLVTKAAVEALPKLEAKASLVLPLHYESLDGAEIDRILDCLQSAGSVNKQSLIIEIIAPNDSNIVRNIIPAIRSFKNWAREVALRTSISGNIEVFQNTGITAIGADLAAPENRDFAEDVMLPLIAGFASRVNRLWLYPYFWGIRSKPQIIVAAQSNAFWVNSMGLMKPLSNPVKPTPAAKSKLGL